MAEKPNMAKGFTKCSKEEVHSFWQHVTATLNSLGPPTKDATNWRKVWLDWKCYIKRKLSENKKEVKATGGGGNRSHTFNDMENEVIRLTGLETCTSGISGASFFGVPETPNGMHLLPETPGPARTTTNPSSPPYGSTEHQDITGTLDSSMHSLPETPEPVRYNSKPVGATALLKEQLELQKRHYEQQQAQNDRIYKIECEKFEEAKRHNKALEEIMRKMYE